MHVASNMAKAKDFIEEFVGRLEPRADEVALFTFGKSLRREVSFTKDGDDVYDALDGVKPWGLTSLYDAIAQTAEQLGDRTSQRRAVVVVTDGADTSRLSRRRKCLVWPAASTSLCTSSRLSRRSIIRGPRPRSFPTMSMGGSRMSRSGREENCAMSAGPNRLRS